MDIDSKLTDDVLCLTVQESRIDAAGAVAFKEKIRSLVTDFSGRVVIDMHKVDFLDSSGLGALVAVMKMLDGGRRLELARCGTIVRKVLMLTRMDSVFELHETVPSGVGSGQDAA